MATKVTHFLYWGGIEEFSILKVEFMLLDGIN